MTPQKIKTFQKIVCTFYKENARSFPWRTTTNPYHILVSEIMLQQTQTDRVVPKFKHFMTIFPTVKSLAHAPLKDVLRAWQGLGYNRRALMLHKTAQEIVVRHKGIIPNDITILKTLPGVGPYTASAITVFAYNTPAIVIETNIRAVFIHHFFKNKDAIHDTKLLPLIKQTLDAKNPREWYSALMDYGAYLKKKFPNPSRKSAQYMIQSKFDGSDRQIRGAIIRALTQKNTSKQVLFKILAPHNPSPERFGRILEKLIQEGMVTKYKTVYTLSV